MPLKKSVSVEGIDVREILAARCVTLVHHGSYAELGWSYAKIFEFARSGDLDFSQPPREIYIKGPGMLFKGDPQKYLTEIQLSIVPNS